MSNVQCLPFTSTAPKTKELATLLPLSGFRSLNNATPEDLPAGSIVVLYNTGTFTFETVVVRNLENGMLFYTRQTGRSYNTWHNTFLGDTKRDDYLFKVIS